MIRRLDSLDLRVAVVGGGRVGIRTAKMLDEHGHTVVVVERDPDRCQKISDEYIATVIEGDATSPNVLRQVDLDNCDVVAALTGNTGTNLGVCVLADRLANVRTIMRVESEEGEGGYEDIVDQVVFPERLGAIGAVDAIEGKDIRFIEGIGGELKIMDIEVSDRAPVSGKRLEEIRFPEGSLVISDQFSNDVAGPETVLEAGKRYLIAAEPEVSDEIRSMLRG